MSEAKRKPKFNTQEVIAYLEGRELTWWDVEVEDFKRLFLAYITKELVKFKIYLDLIPHLRESKRIKK